MDLSFDVKIIPLRYFADFIRAAFICPFSFSLTLFWRNETKEQKYEWAEIVKNGDKQQTEKTWID